MELATALHHSAQGLKKRVVEEPREEELPVEHKATSGQIATLPWGVRPAHPLDVSAQPPLVAATCVAAGVPSLSSPALGGDCSLDSATVSFLVRLAVGAQAELDRRKRREEEEKTKKAKEAKESSKQFLDQLRATAWRELEERLDSGGASSKRKRKKRRKRRTPRTSSLPGRARRRLRQWSACSAGFTGDDVPRVMFPSGVVRPKMLGIMAGMVQMDSCSGMARLVLLVTVHLVLCFLPCLQARDARHHGRYGPGGLVCWFLTLSLALCSSCCLRPQRPVIMTGMDHRTVWRFTGAVLGQGFLHARCCATSGVLVQTVLYTVWRFRSCSSSRSSTFPVDTQCQFPMVLTFHLIIKVLQLQLIDKVADVLFVHVVQVPQVQVVILTCFPSSWCRSWRRQSRFHSCHVTLMTSR